MSSMLEAAHQRRKWMALIPSVAVAAPEAEAAQEEEAQEALAEAPAGTATEEEARLEVPRPRRQQNVPGPKFKFHSPFTVPLLSRLCVQLLMEFLPLHSRLSAG